MPTEPLFTKFAWSNDMFCAIVIVVSVLSNFVLEKPIGKERNVVCVLIIESVVSRHQRNIV